MAGPIFLGAPMWLGGQRGALFEVGGREAGVPALAPRWARRRGAARRRWGRAARRRGRKRASRMAGAIFLGGRDAPGGARKTHLPGARVGGGCTGHATAVNTSGRSREARAAHGGQRKSAPRELLTSARFFFAASPARSGVSCGTRATRALDLGHWRVWRREPRGRASRGRGRCVRGVAGGGKPHLQNCWRDSSPRRRRGRGQPADPGATVAADLGHWAPGRRGRRGSASGASARRVRGGARGKKRAPPEVLARFFLAAPSALGRSRAAAARPSRARACTAVV